MKHALKPLSLAFVVLFTLQGGPASGQATSAKASCSPAGGQLLYDCRFELNRGGAPIDGVQLVVGADMPSMPMAHNVKPVRARPGQKAGEYVARIQLEMAGHWMLKLRISGPYEDLVLVPVRLDEPGSGGHKH